MRGWKCHLWDEDGCRKMFGLFWWEFCAMTDDERIGMQHEHFFGTLDVRFLRSFQTLCPNFSDDDWWDVFPPACKIGSARTRLFGGRACYGPADFDWGRQLAIGPHCSFQLIPNKSHSCPIRQFIRLNSLSTFPTLAHCFVIILKESKAVSAKSNFVGPVWAPPGRVRAPGPGVFLSTWIPTVPMESPLAWEKSLANRKHF